MRLLGVQTYEYDSYRIIEVKDGESYDLDPNLIWLRVNNDGLIDDIENYLKRSLRIFFSRNLKAPLNNNYLVFDNGDLAKFKFDLLKTILKSTIIERMNMSNVANNVKYFLNYNKLASRGYVLTNISKESLIAEIYATGDIELKEIMNKILDSYEKNSEHLFMTKANEVFEKAVRSGITLDNYDIVESEIKDLLRRLQ